MKNPCMVAKQLSSAKNSAGGKNVMLASGGAKNVMLRRKQLSDVKTASICGKQLSAAKTSFSCYNNFSMQKPLCGAKTTLGCKTTLVVPKTPCDGQNLWRVKSAPGIEKAQAAPHAGIIVIP